MKWFNATRIWFALSLVAALVIPPLVLPATSGFDENSKRVNRMSQSERNQLRNNYTDYLSLGETERLKYAALHESLEQDAAENGRLTRAMEDYLAWRQTLPLDDKDELRTTTDVTQRIELIKQFIEDQEERKLREFTRMNWWLRRTSVVPPEDFAAVMRQVESSITFSSGERDRLDAKPDGVERYLEFFKILSERKLRLSPSENNTQAVLSPSRANQIIQLLPKDVQDRVNESEELNGRIRALGGVIFANVRHQFQLEMRSRRPDEAKLNALIAEWPEEDREELDRILRLPPDEFLKELNERYFAQEMALDIGPLYSALGFPRRGFGGRPPFRQPGGGRPPEGGGRLPDGGPDRDGRGGRDPRRGGG